MRISSRLLARVTTRGLYNFILLLLIVIMLLPNVIVFLLSFSGASFIKFPPPSWGLRQYEVFFGSSKWLQPLGRSLVLALTVAILGVTLGASAVIAFARSRLPGRNLIQTIALGPLLVPGIAYAVAVYALFVRLRLVDTFWGLVVAHTMGAIPYALLIVGAAINRVPEELELAAMSLGASRWRAYRDITIPLLLPALFAALIFAFIGSFEEVVMASFLSGSRYLTLPKAIFDSVRYGVDAVVTAIATIMSIGTALLLTSATLIRRRLS